LLEAGDRLTKRFSARLAVSGLKLGKFQPPEQGSDSYPGCARRVLDVALGKQRGDRFLLFASDFGPVSCHQMPTGCL
jgi:hypothetical protein